MDGESYRVRTCHMTSSDKISQMSRTLHSAEILETEKGTKKTRMWILHSAWCVCKNELPEARGWRMSIQSCPINGGVRIAQSTETGPFGFPLFADLRSFRAGTPYTYSAGRLCWAWKFKRIMKALSVICNIRGDSKDRDNSNVDCYSSTY